MSRRHAAQKREILPDPKYGDQVLAKFINLVMSRGLREKFACGPVDLLDGLVQVFLGLEKVLFLLGSGI